MNTPEILLLAFTLLSSITSFAIGHFQFKEKGFLFNNSYIYASKEERRKINKKPYYRQSAIAFITVGIIFAMIALAIVTDWNWLFSIVILCSILLIAYAIISSIIIEKNKK